MRKKDSNALLLLITLLIILFIVKTCSRTEEETHSVKPRSGSLLYTIPDLHDPSPTPTQNEIVALPEKKITRVEAPIIQSVPTPAAQKCGTANKTVASLLSSDTNNSAKNKVIQYEISKQDCEGNAVSLSGSKILFDIDAYQFSLLNGIYLPMPPHSVKYSLSTATGKILASGTFNLIVGTDLFGHQGDHFCHYKQNVSANTPPDTTVLILSVSLGEDVFHNRESYNSKTLKKIEMIPTHLKIDDSEPVEQLISFENDTTGVFPPIKGND